MGWWYGLGGNENGITCREKNDETSYCMSYDNFDFVISSLSLGIGNNSKLKNYDQTRLMLYFLGKVSVEYEGDDVSDKVIYYPERDLEKNILKIIMYIPLENSKLKYISDNVIYYDEYSYVATLLSGYQGYYAKLSKDDANEFAIVPTPKNFNLQSVLNDEDTLKWTL